MSLFVCLHVRERDYERQGEWSKEKERERESKFKRNHIVNYCEDLTHKYPWFKTASIFKIISILGTKQLAYLKPLVSLVQNS